MAGRAKYDSRNIYNIGVRVSSEVSELKSNIMSDFEIRFGSLLMKENKKKTFSKLRNEINNDYIGLKTKKTHNLVKIPLESAREPFFSGGNEDKGTSLFSMDLLVMEGSDHNFQKRPAMEFSTKRAYI